MASQPKETHERDCEDLAASHLPGRRAKRQALLKAYYVTLDKDPPEPLFLAGYKRGCGRVVSLSLPPPSGLAVPLLRQDLENLKASQQRALEASTNEIDRVYDQNKWFIGLMFTMAIGLISLAISNFVQARRKPEPTEKPP